MMLFAALLPLLEGVGGLSGTFGLVSVSDSVACTATSLLGLAKPIARGTPRLRRLPMGCMLHLERVTMDADRMVPAVALLVDKACCMLQ